MQNLEWYLADLKSTGKNTIETVEKSLTDMFIRLVRIYPCLEMLSQTPLNKTNICIHWWHHGMLSPQGTIWFNYYGGKEAAYFMSKLGYEAMVSYTQNTVRKYIESWTLNYLLIKKIRRMNRFEKYMKNRNLRTKYHGKSHILWIVHATLFCHISSLHVFAGSHETSVCSCGYNVLKT